MVSRITCFVLIVSAVPIISAQESTENQQESKEVQAVLDRLATYSLDKTVTVPFRLNSPISIEIVGKTQDTWSRYDKTIPWAYRIGLIECRAKKSEGKIIIDTDVIGTNFGTDYRIPLHCRLLDASGKFLSEIVTRTTLKTVNDPISQMVSFEFTTSSERFNFVRDYSYQLWQESSKLKDHVNVYEGLRLGNWAVNPQDVHFIQFYLHIGEPAGRHWGSTFLYR